MQLQIRYAQVAPGIHIVGVNFQCARHQLDGFGMATLVAAKQAQEMQRRWVGGKLLQVFAIAGLGSGMIPATMRSDDFLQALFGRAHVPRPRGMKKKSPSSWP